MRTSLDADVPNNFHNDEELQLKASHGTYYPISLIREEKSILKRTF